MKNNYYLITGIITLSVIAGIAIGDIGEILEYKSKKWTILDAATIIFVFTIIYFHGFIAGRKSKEE